MECALNDITVNYEAFGEGVPFLMLHGAAGDHRYWLLTLEPLFAKRAGWRRIYPDLPGHGKTPAPAWMNTQDDVLDVLLDFIDATIPGQQFAVGGYSWGGYLAQGLLHHRFSQVIGCLFIATSIGLPKAGRDLPQRAVLVKDEKPLAGLGENDETVLLRYLYENMLVVQTPANLERMKRVLLPAASIADDQDFGERVSESFSFNPRELPYPSDKPALFLLGRQDSLVGYRNQWELLNSHPRATFAVLDSAGHGVAGIEQVEVCEALINGWLDRVEQI